MKTFDEWWKKEGLLYFGTGTENDARSIWEAAQGVEREACLAEIEQGIWFDKTTSEILDSISEAIRARGQK